MDATYDLWRHFIFSTFFCYFVSNIVRMSYVECDKYLIISFRFMFFDHIDSQTTDDADAVEFSHSSEMIRSMRSTHSHIKYSISSYANVHCGYASYGFPVPIQYSTIIILWFAHLMDVFHFFLR